MADDNQDRNRQAYDEEQGQQERELREERDRDEEPAPVHDDPGERLGNLDEELEHHEYPTTTDELIDRYGDQEIESQDGVVSVEEVIAPIDNEMYDSADDVRSRIQGLIHRG